MKGSMGATAESTAGGVGVMGSDPFADLIDLVWDVRAGSRRRCGRGRRGCRRSVVGSPAMGLERLGSFRPAWPLLIRSSRRSRDRRRKRH